LTTLSESDSAVAAIQDVGALPAVVSLLTTTDEDLIQEVVALSVNLSKHGTKFCFLLSFPLIIVSLFLFYAVYSSISG
jgi:hypothetical protein